MKFLPHSALWRPGLLLLLAMLCARCEKELQIDIPAQREAFESFLEGVATNDGLAVDRELARRYIYRLTPGPGGKNERVKEGDAVTIEYYGYAFSRSARWGIGGIFTTNNPEAAVQAGLTDRPSAALPPRELVFRQGAGEILRGIEQGVVGAGLRDTMLLYLTSDLTYGNQTRGLINPGTPTVFRVIVHGINE